MYAVPILQTRSQQDKLGDDELRMKSSAVEITTVEQLRNRITKVAKHKYRYLRRARNTVSVPNTVMFINTTLHSFRR